MCLVFFPSGKKGAWGRGGNGDTAPSRGWEVLLDPVPWACGDKISRLVFFVLFLNLTVDFQGFKII